MSNTKTGGPAFPRPAGDYNGTKGGNLATLGMSLRDYFAATAMPAVYRDLWDDVRAGRNNNITEDWRIGVAMDAYEMADAMLKARELKNERTN